MRKSQLAVLLASALFFTCVPQASVAVSGVITAEAHGGRTDSQGGHRDNKNVSGLGSYHYHCGGHPAHLHTNGVCPYAANTASGTGTAGNTGAAKNNAQNSTAEQQPTVPEHIDYVFDARYYATSNDDLYETYGYDHDKLLTHFLTSGMKEGRRGCEAFDVKAYKSNNQDLADSYGDDWEAYYNHYMTCGHDEGRICQ